MTSWPAPVPAPEPTAQDARRWLREELLQPEYRDLTLLARLQEWLDRTLATAATVPGAATAAAIVVLLAILVSVLWLTSRTRGSSRRGATPGPVLGGPSLTAAGWRDRATTAWEDGRYEDVVVDGFRAVAAAAAEAGRLELTPGLTAHEAAGALVATAPPGPGIEHLRQAADLFDGVRYGGHSATPEHAVLVLGLVPDRVAPGPR